MLKKSGDYLINLKITKILNSNKSKKLPNKSSKLFDKSENYQIKTEINKILKLFEKSESCQSKHENYLINPKLPNKYFKIIY